MDVDLLNQKTSNYRNSTIPKMQSERVSQLFFQKRVNKKINDGGLGQNPLPD